MRKIALATVIALLIAVQAFAWSAKCVGVVDGDTVDVLRPDKSQVRLRLWGIDAPESGQPHGRAAKTALSALVFGKTVEVETTETDKYKRPVARIVADDTDVNREMITVGLAWVYRQYCKGPEREEWLKLEATARENKLGLWADQSPIPPWEWRQGKTNKAGVAAGVYRGNTESLVFHREGCKHYACKNCVKVFQSKEAAIDAGYRPCRQCRP